MKEYKYKVSGLRHLFPYDMLRYDSCWPSDSDSAALLYHPIPHPASVSDTKEENKLVSVSISSHKPPTIDRWSSFGYIVTNVIVYKV